MARNRFVKPGVVRVPLSDDDWIDLKRELTVGEARQILFSTLEEQGDGTFKRNLDAAIMLRLLSYIVAWSFVDDGRPVPVSADAINALDVPTLTELISAVNAHEASVQPKNE